MFEFFDDFGTLAYYDKQKWTTYFKKVYAENSQDLFYRSAVERIFLYIIGVLFIFLFWFILCF